MQFDEARTQLTLQEKTVEGLKQQAAIASAQMQPSRSSRLDELRGSLGSISFLNGEKASNTSASMPI